MSPSLQDCAPGERHRQDFPAITTTQLAMYAGASDDYNRIHYDQDYAKSAGLGGVIAHGMLTMALMTRALTDWAGPGGTVRKLSARFVAPVRPGDVVSVEVVVEAREEMAERHDLACSATAKVGERTVATLDATVAFARQ